CESSSPRRHGGTEKGDDPSPCLRVSVVKTTSIDLDERLPRRDGVALLRVHGLDDARSRRADLVLHLHGLDEDEPGAALDLVAGLDEDLAARAGHGRLERGVVRGVRARGALAVVLAREPDDAALDRDRDL